jgi:hypothetical protein
MIDAIRINYVLTRLLKKDKCRLRRLRLSNRTCEEVCHASSIVMASKPKRNIHGQICDMRKVCYPAFYDIHVAQW